MTFQHIDQKKKRLDEKRPLPVNTVKSLRENMLIEWTYNSNAIEGNTLTISETKVVLAEQGASRVAELLVLI